MSKGKKLFDDFLASVSKNIGVMQISFGEMIIIKTQQSILLDYIAELEAENRWIPVSERLPEDKGEYLCYSKPDIFTCFFGDSWNGTDAFRSVIAPTHWRPLPQPPEEEK